MWKWLEVETENVPNSLLDIENVNRGKDKHSEKLWFYFLGIAISNNYLENFLNFVLNYTYFNCRGPDFLKRGKCKILRIAKLCRQRHFSRKHYQPYKESTHARSFPFCIRAALLICQSEAVASSKRKKGKEAIEQPALARHSLRTTLVYVDRCAAQLGLGAIAVWQDQVTIPLVSLGVEKSFFCPGRRKQSGNGSPDAFWSIFPATT